MIQVSLRGELVESLRALGRGASLPRKWRAQEGWPARGRMALLRPWGWVGPLSPLALVLLGVLLNHRSPGTWQWALAFLLFVLSAIWVRPSGIGTLSAFDALRAPSRDALLAGRWLGFLPKAVFVGLCWVAFVLLQGEQVLHGGLVDRKHLAENWPGLLGLGLAPSLLAAGFAWRETRDPGSPECRCATGFLRAGLGLFVIALSSMGWYGFGKLRLLSLALFGLWTIAGATLAWIGGKDAIRAFLSVPRRKFRPGLLLGEPLSVLLIGTTGMWVFLSAISLGEATLKSGPLDGMAPILAGLLGGSVFLVLGARRIFLAKEVLPPLPSVRGEASARREDFDQAMAPLPMLLRGRRPRGFASACVFRGRATFAPVLVLVMFTFGVFCIFTAMAEPHLVPLVAALPVLIFPAITGVDVSPRLHLLGADYRTQHLRNLGSLLGKVALPAALVCAAALAYFPPSEVTFPEKRWTISGLVLSAVLLRAGMLGPWRCLAVLGVRVPFAALVSVAAACPLFPFLLGLNPDYDISTQTLARFYGWTGGIGLALHLATLREAWLRSEMRWRAERS